MLQRASLVGKGYCPSLSLGLHDPTVGDNQSLCLIFPGPACVHFPAEDLGLCSSLSYTDHEYTSFAEAVGPSGESRT